MSETIRDLISGYLEIRRSLGFKLEGNERVLTGFAGYLDQRGAHGITVDDAVAFATAPAGASPRYQAMRLSAIRCFTQWASLLDASIEVPPDRLLPARPTRAAPWIYTCGQISSLLGAAGRLQPAFRAATYRCLIGLMAATGIRTGEALGTGTSGFNEQDAILTVTGKYGKTRALPLHPTVAAELAGYLRERARHARADCPALLVSTRGTRLLPQVVHQTFRTLADQAGLVQASTACRPRLHDLRHYADGWVMRPAVTFPLAGAAELVLQSA